MSIFDDVLAKPEDGGTPDGNIFGSLAGSPTMDRTATDNWRSTYTTPALAEQTHLRDLSSATPATPGTPVTTSLDSSHFTNQGPQIDMGGLTKGFVDTFAPDSDTNIFKRMGRGFVAGAQQATEGVPQWGHELDEGPAGVFGKLFAPVSAVAGGTLGALNAPFLDPNSDAFRRNQEGALGVLLGGAMTHGGPEPGVRVPREPIRTLEAPRPLGEPTRPLALGPGSVRPAPDVIASGPGRVIDTTARELTPEEKFRAQIEASIARQKANPTPTNELGNRHPVSERDPGAVAPITLEDLRARIGATEPPAAPRGLLARTGPLTPVGREDLTLGPKVNTIPPVPIDDLRARIGSDQWQPNVPLDAEQLAARIGATSPAQRAVAENLKTQVAAREAQAAEPRQATGTLGASGMSGPLVGRAIGRSSSQLARAGLKSEGLTASPGDLSASLARQAKVHDANEAVIAAVKSGDKAAEARARADVQLLGGDANHTDARVLAATRRQRITTDATTTQDFQASIDALKAKGEGTRGSEQLLASGRSDLRAGVGRKQDALGPPKQVLADTSKAGAESPASSLPRSGEPPVPTGHTRLYRVEAADLRPRDTAGMRKGLGEKFYAKWVDERGRLFGDSADTLRDYGHGEPGMATYYVDVPNDLANATRREALKGNNPNEKFNEYLLPQDIVAKKRPMPGAVDLTDKFGPLTNTGGFGGSRAPSARNFLKEEGGSATVGGALHGIGSDLLRPNVSRIAENVAGTGKTLTTAMSPFHFMFRHALPFMAAHPAAWLKGGAKGLGEGFTMTPAKLDARIQTMHDNLTRNGLGNVYLGKPHLGAIGGEESVASNWLTKLGPLGSVIQRSGQGFAQGLNEVRYEAAKGAVNSSEWMAKHGLAQRMNFADRRAIGDAINHFSGRGLDTANMGDTGKAAMRLLNVPMFSPQLATARVRMLGDFANGLQEITGDLAHGRAPRADAIERARLGVGYIIGVGALYLLMKAATGNGPDLNPVSSTFGQVDAGDRGPAQAAAGFLAPELGMGFNSYDKQPSRVDPTASEATLVRNIARLALSIYDRASGQSNLKKLTGNQQEQSPVDVATSAIVSQIFTSPIGYPIAEWLRGYGVEPLDSITPMPITGALKGAGVQMPTVGGKETKTTGSTTPRTGSAPTRKPVKK